MSTSEGTALLQSIRTAANNYRATYKAAPLEVWLSVELMAELTLKSKGIITGIWGLPVRANDDQTQPWCLIGAEGVTVA